MSQLKTLLVGAALIAASLTALLVTSEWGLGRRADGETRWRYLLEDTYDRYAYQKRGRWLASGGTPYLQEFSEYPQLTTWMMGLPYLLFDHRVERGEPFGTVAPVREFFLDAGIPEEQVDAVFNLLGNLEYDPESVLEGRPGPLTEQLKGLQNYPEIDRGEALQQLFTAWEALDAWADELERNRDAYADLHQVLMAGWFLLLLLVTTANLRTLGHGPGWALLLFLPATLYFGFSRFEPPIVALVGTALLCQLRGRRRLAAFVLGVSIMVKWYPLVLVPLFLSNNFYAARERRRAAGQPLELGPALLRQVLIPGSITAAVILAILSVTFFWRGGGLAAVTAVFDWHLNVRVPNHASVLSIATNPDAWGWFGMEQRPLLEKVFLGLQLGPPFLIAFLPLRSRRALLEACLFATVGMVFFSKFFSPQWVLWVTALALLLAPRRRLYAVLIFLLQVVVYLQLPVFYYEGVVFEDGVQKTSAAFRIATDMRVIGLVAFWVLSLAGLIWALLRPPAEDAGDPNGP